MGSSHVPHTGAAGIQKEVLSVARAALRTAVAHAARAVTSDPQSVYAKIVSASVTS